MKALARYLRYSTCCLFVFAIAGCGTTAIIDTHPLIAQSPDSEIAKINFLRTDPGFDGVGGNAFTISLGGEDLLTIAKGEYALTYLKNYSGDVTVESSTVVYRGGLNTWIKVEESQHFNFEGPKTYYVTFSKIFNDTIMGTSYIAQSITEDIAKRLARELKPVGDAMAHPL